MQYYWYYRLGLSLCLHFHQINQPWPTNKDNPIKGVKKKLLHQLHLRFSSTQQAPGVSFPLSSPLNDDKPQLAYGSEAGRLEEREREGGRKQNGEYPMSFKRTAWAWLLIGSSCFLLLLPAQSFLCSVVPYLLSKEKKIRSGVHGAFWKTKTRAEV